MKKIVGFIIVLGFLQVELLQTAQDEMEDLAEQEMEDLNPIEDEIDHYQYLVQQVKTFETTLLSGVSPTANIGRLTETQKKALAKQQLEGGLYLLASAGEIKQIVDSIVISRETSVKGWTFRHPLTVKDIPKSEKVLVEGYENTLSIVLMCAIFKYDIKAVETILSAVEKIQNLTKNKTFLKNIINYKDPKTGISPLIASIIVIRLLSNSEQPSSRPSTVSLATKTGASLDSSSARGSISSDSGSSSARGSISNDSSQSKISLSKNATARAILKLLLTIKGIDLKITDNHHTNAVWYAQYNSKLIEFLLKNGFKK